MAYIDREALIDCLRKERSEIEIREDDDKAFNLGVHQGYVFAIHDAKSIPAADVRPVVRGTWGRRWICSSMSGYEYACSCSACSKPTYRMSLLEKMPNFCPNCGADMREG